jgi:hypothetical protein
VLIQFASSFCGTPLGSTPGGHCFLGISASLAERLAVIVFLAFLNLWQSASPFHLVSATRALLLQLPPDVLRM